MNATIIALLVAILGLMLYESAGKHEDHAAYKRAQEVCWRKNMDYVRHGPRMVLCGLGQERLGVDLVEVVERD